MMSEGASDRHLSWEAFERLVAMGLPALERVLGVPQVDIFTDARGSRIGLRIFVDDPAPWAPLAEIEIRQTIISGKKAVEISTTNSSLYREFYAFACSVADGVQIGSMSPARAVESAMASWTALLERVAVLSPERQTGLLGELWMVERLAGAHGWESAVCSWKGPDAEEHDFSLENLDVEVKTTVSERRIHMISSLTQLLPNPGRALYVLSLQFTRSGLRPGKTLGEAVARIQAATSASSSSSRDSLESRLSEAGWREEHMRHYTVRWSLRSPAQLVPVDDWCPSIVPSTLASLGSGRLSRVVQVSYRINLEGLGVEDDSPEFRAILA